MKNKRERLTYLTTKYSNDKITPHEASEMVDLILELEGPARHRTFMSHPVNQKKMAAALQQGNTIDEETYHKAVQQFKRGKYALPAWVILGIVCMTVILFFCLRPSPAPAPTASLSDSCFTYDTFNDFIDGSKIVTQAGSVIRHDFNNKREFQLTGTAYFTIGKDRKHPCVIKCNGAIQTTVLGTSFHLSTNTPGYLYIINVTEGSVKVCLPQATEQLVKAGQQLKVSNSNQIETGPLDSSLQAWLARDLQFDNIPFDSVARILSRRYGVHIKCKTPAIRQQLIHMHFKGTEPLTDIAAALCTLVPCRYEPENDNDILFY